MHLEQSTIEQSTANVSLPVGETKLCQLIGCPREVSISRTGRPRKFCSPAHKLQAFRARHHLTDVGRLAAPAIIKKDKGYRSCPGGPSGFATITTSVDEYGIEYVLPISGTTQPIEQRYAQPVVLGEVQAHIEVTKKGKPEVQFDRHPAPEIESAIRKDEFGRQFSGDRFIPRRPRRKKAA